MRLKIVFLLLLANLLIVAGARAAHTQVQLLLSADTAKSGDTILAGVDLKMESGWHTYWKNPGDAGEATEIKWTLPAGVTAGAIQWPLPKKLPPAEVTTYGYEDEVMLLVPLTLATNLPAGALNLAAKVSWLECKDVCIPANQDVAAKLNVRSETKNSADAAMIESWKNKVPGENRSSILGGVWLNSAWWEASATNDVRSLIIDRKYLAQPGAFSTYDSADFFPDASDNFEVQPATELITANNTEIRLRKLVKKFSDDWPKKISGVLFGANARLGSQSLHEGSQQAYEADFFISNQVPVNISASLQETKKASADASIVSTSPNSNAGAPATKTLAEYLLYAFIGGLILNIMPCVLPVIALKILGFVSEAKSSPGRVRALGGIYAIGVLFSFLVLAAIVIGVKAAGHQAGWGMQFGSPIFIVCLTTLVTLVALNLFGVFEVTLGGRTLDAAGNLASRHGASGAFFNGVLATILATPCTAPFLGAALGFAFAQSAATIIFIFLTVGLGLASPYVLLSWNPVWLKFLPKPGAWMEKFKIAMGFPMLATVVWLLNIAGASYGKNVLWLGVFLVVVAFAAWIFGEFFQRGRAHKGITLALVFLLFSSGYFFVLEKELDWRNALPEADSIGSLKKSADGIDWQLWSPEAVAQARTAGKIVLVDFTADWCLTCQVNKKTSIEISSVREKLKSLNAVAFVGDYTRTPDNITTELNRYNRAGVPLVLVYPKNADASPLVLPEVLTPGIVLNALDQAAR
ncbi:MAG TPA: protein-disulfide reductase DsbD domain-containing protein [Verrucomicrobiae bacterium]